MNRVWILLWGLGTLSFSLNGLAQGAWKLREQREGGELRALVWQQGETIVPAVSASVLTAIRSTESKGQRKALYSNERYGHAVVVLPPQIRGGLGLKGDLIPLIPGTTAERGLGAQPMEVSLAPGGFYFTSAVANVLSVKYYGVEKKKEETLVQVSAFDFSQTAVQIRLTESGAEVQAGGRSMVYEAGGKRVAGEMLFEIPSGRNLDTIEGEFAGRDINKAIRRGFLDAKPEDPAIETIVLSLAAKPRRSVLLLGGQTAELKNSVYSLAAAIGHGKYPALKDWRIIQLDWTRFNTAGQVERSIERVQKLVDAARQKKIILFFEDIDRLVGLGTDGGAFGVDASSAFVPELSAGRIVLLGTVSGPDSLERLRDRAPGFLDQFRQIKVGEPDRGSRTDHTAMVCLPEGEGTCVGQP